MGVFLGETTSPYEVRMSRTEKQIWFGELIAPVRRSLPQISSKSARFKKFFPLYQKLVQLSKVQYLVPKPLVDISLINPIDP